jgi:hypothetical protein
MPFDDWSDSLGALLIVLFLVLTIGLAAVTWSIL